MTVICQDGYGVGDPFERDVAAVSKDVIEEKVSVEVARRDYGAVVDLDTLEVDVEATKKIRA